VDDLEVAIGTCRLGAEKHGYCLTLRASKHIPWIKATNKRNYAEEIALHF
jgi:hypothetical protein